MRKIIYILTILSFLISCSKNNKDEIIEIGERVFVGQVNEIYLNTNDYLGKKLKIEGLFMAEDGGYGEAPFYAVYRFGPGGCCGIDGIVGFEVKWANDKIQKYPENDAWVEAVGALKTNNQYLYIELASLTAKETRGKEFVIR